MVKIIYKSQQYCKQTRTPPRPPTIQRRWQSSTVKDRRRKRRSKSRQGRYAVAARVERERKRENIHYSTHIMSFFSSTSRGGSSATPSPAGIKTAALAAVALEIPPTRNGETDGGGGRRRSSTGTTTGEGTMTTTTTRTPHYHFLHSMILPATVKIQKELKGRKFKVRLIVRCQCVCVWMCRLCCLSTINTRFFLTL